MTTNTCATRGAGPACHLSLEVETTTRRLRRVTSEQVCGAHPFHATTVNECILRVVAGELKFIIMGPVSVVLLVRANTADAAARRGGRRVDCGSQSMSHAAAGAEPMLHR